MAATTRAQLLARQFALHTRLFNNVLDGLDEAGAGKRLSDAVNHAKWIAGHVLSARWSLTAFVGIDRPNPYEEFFGHGKAIRDDIEYPALDSLREQWNTISPRLEDGLAKLDDAALDGDAPFEVPIGDTSVAGLLAFLMHHEAYHIGQLGLLRKFIKREPMSYA